MAHCDTVLSQLLKWAPRHEFESLAKRHHMAARSVSRRVGRSSSPFHGAGDRPRQLARHRRQPWCSGASTLSLGRRRIVPLQPGAHQSGQALYVVRGTVREAVTTLPGGRARPQVSFQYSLDATTIELCLSTFPWADFRTTKGAG